MASYVYGKAAHVGSGLIEHWEEKSVRIFTLKYPLVGRPKIN